MSHDIKCDACGQAECVCQPLTYQPVHRKPESGETTTLRARVAELEAAIREHRSGVWWGNDVLDIEDADLYAILKVGE